MSSWRAQENEATPQDFLELLYHNEDEASGDEESDGEIENDLVYEDELRDCGGRPKVEVVSPHSVHRSSPRVDEESPLPCTSSYDRPRSPLGPISSESAYVVLKIYDEDGMELDADDDSAFLAPDTHALYVSPEQRDRDERNISVSGRRGGRRDGRRGGRTSMRGQSTRGRGYPSHGRRVRNSWVVGQPLNEIWLTDDDVPPELVSLATDVLRRRQMRMRDSARAERNAEPEDTSESDEDDEFYDASNGADDLPGLEGQNLRFEWSPMDSFQGKEEHFKQKRTGSVQFVNSAYDAFRLYWGDDILDLIVNETNIYASKIESASFKSEWYPTNTHEILCLFSFWMMLGIVRMPTITSCFSVDPLLKTEVFRRIFTRRRYEMLNRALNFVDYSPAMDNSNPSNTSARSLDQLHCLRPIITHLNSRFQSNYILNKDICIDESLTLWKGRLKFKQYIHNKASKFGIKTFELCESSTGYLWSFIVYSGKDLEQSLGVLKSTAVVKKLIGPLLNKGYRLFMDNWYNSPLLARFLKLNGTDCVGTLRSTRKDVPLIVNKAPLKRGELIARHSGDVSVLSWQDKKRITMISTCHGSSTALPTVSSRPRSHPVPFKPQVVLDYNKFMGGVDLKDQMLEPYLLERKRCAKWSIKLFKRLLNVSILNSRTLVQSSTKTQHDHLAFRLQLVDSILKNHLVHCPRTRRQTVTINRSTNQQPNRFIVSTHWPVLLEQTEGSIARNRNFTKRCVVCLQQGRKSQRSPYCCESCRVPLCIRDCFKSYHTFSP